MGAIDIFTSDIVKDVGEGLDNLFTSDEERLQAKNVFAGINERIVKAGNDLSAKMNQALSDRHKVDMNSDSWLSKNVRPLALVVMTIATLSFVFFVHPKTTIELDAYKVKLALLTSLDTLIFGFYFGSRGVEKVAASVAKVMNRPKKKKPVDFNEDEDW